MNFFHGVLKKFTAGHGPRSLKKLYSINPPRRKQNALAVVEGPEGPEDWRVYKGPTLLSKFATEQEARADFERRGIRRYFN